MLTSASSKSKAILICVGSELLRGKLNTHASHIARRLASIGLTLDEEHTVGDELGQITQAIRQGLNSYPIVFLSGGLGPTFDDISREAAAEATGCPLWRSKALMNGIKAKFRRAHFKMPDMNIRQADLLQGAEVIENRFGTAPGQWIKFSDSQVLVLFPGPPRELYPMLEDFVLPRLKRMYPRRPMAESHMHFVNVPESIIDSKVRPIIARAQKTPGVEVQFTILAQINLVDFDIFVSAAKLPLAQKVLARIEHEVRRASAGTWYGSNMDYPLEKVVGDLFRKRRASLALAESCTGGMLAARLTDIAGSSEFLQAGWVTYSNAAKVRDLGVPAQLIRAHGAVSEPVARAMAQGARKAAQTDVGLGITGIAGPGGGSPGKPVGLVYIALATEKRVSSQRFEFSGDRSSIRQRAVLAALDILRKI